MSVRFKIGEICVHKNFICRVDAVERCIVGVTRSSCYSTKDGTELNPTLTLTALYGPDGEPVKNAKPRKAVSGYVRRLSEEVGDMEAQVVLLQKKLQILRSLRNAK
jgi:hypothetical protein